MIFILLDGRIVTVLTPDERGGQMCQNNKMQMLLKTNCASDSEGIEHPPIPVDHGQILIPLNWKRKKHANSATVLSGELQQYFTLRGQVQLFVLSLHSLMIALSLPLPPPPPSHFLFLTPPPLPRVLLSFV